MFKTNIEAAKIVGGLSKPSKMPCKSFNLPASRCKVGSQMAKVDGTICSGCYALKGRYNFRPVQKALERRFKKLDHPKWSEAMAYLIGNDRYFRWHDSGDIRDMKHLQNIVEVAKKTPQTLHWLPTREYMLIRQYVEQFGGFPKNLIVRLSAARFNGKPPEALAKLLNVQCSSASDTDWNCPASKQGNKCLNCRKCWNPEIFNVTYHSH